MNKTLDFTKCFKGLTGHQPMGWQRRLYDEQFSLGHIPDCLTIPTGLGKTSVIHLWLIALANSAPENGAARLPRRLVYVVNRRTIVDQATREAETLREKLRENLASVQQMQERLRTLCAVDAETPLAISTLRGQYADNGEWCADPSRPAIIVGTVDMIGSRLLFSGYGRGFKSRPLHAGFLGQDALLVHDEAHLEPAFQKLLDGIKKEQSRCKDFHPLRVMQMTATSRADEKPFNLIEKDYRENIVKERVEAKKTIAWHPLNDEKKTAEKVAECALARGQVCLGSAILVFVRKVDDVKQVVGFLKHKTKGNVAKERIETLTGTLRGLERDRMADPRRADASRVFARFLKPPKPDPPASERWQIEPIPGTVYLVCTSAGEVGIDISADHLVCDLTPFDSMAQRFGRVNRFGERTDTRIDVVHPVKFDDKKEKEYDTRLQKTLDLLQELGDDGSPKALDKLAMVDRVAAFAPSPTILPVTDILFDAWALTSIREKLPGRPPVEPYLHGVSNWQPPETYVAWRKEVSVITGALLKDYKPKDLLEDYRLKPNELLRDHSDRIFKNLQALANKNSDVPVWVIDGRDDILVTTLGEIVSGSKDDLNGVTVLLAPNAGGLDNGLLDGHAEPSADEREDVADQWLHEDRKPKPDEDGKRRRVRVRVWDDDPQFDEKTKDMRLIRTIDTRSDTDEEDEVETEHTARRYWYWYELPKASENEGSSAAQESVLWETHTDDVTRNVERIVKGLSLPDELEMALAVAARGHDLGKKRESWQRSIGNPDYPKVILAKSGGKRVRLWHSDLPYRHEFGSVLNITGESEFQKLTEEMRDLVLHIVAAHHGRARPHFPIDEAFDLEGRGDYAAKLAREVPRRFARLQRKYGRWGLAYLESLLRAADWAASASPTTCTNTSTAENKL